MYPEPDVTQPETTEPPVDIEPPPEIPDRVTPTRGLFTLRYVPGGTLNPITETNKDNLLLTSLMYESLFVLDGGLYPEPQLCESWDTEDYITFRIRIKPNIAMSDGTWLTADDVAYTFRQALLKGHYVNIFSSVVSVTSDGDLTVTIVLNTPNSRFIRLLDVPIIKSGSIDQRIPPGTGPYNFSGDGPVWLERFSRYRDYRRLPISMIFLLECSDDEMTQKFDDGEISLLKDDPTDAFDMRLNRLNEPRYFDTTTIQFIGFNGRSGIMRDPYVRRAIGCAIDRQYIVDNIMPVQATIPAPLPLSRAFSLYDMEWERRDLDPLVEMAWLLDTAGLQDYDDDSFLELTNWAGGYYKFTVDFIVNGENMHKIRAAHFIADTLRESGFDITVRELPWESYMSALRAGTFDMYYGEIALGADFNLSPLLLPGALNFGGTSSTTYKPFIDDFLYARSQYEIQYAVGRLLDEIERNAPFVPVLYKRYAIYFPVGAISGSSPSQSNVFRNITNWTIDLTMLS